MAKDRSAAALLIAAAALAVSVGGIALGAAALRQLRQETRIDLSMSLQRQFDSDYKQDRADCARAFLYSGQTGKKKKQKGLSQAPYGEIMDFFDSLGYLVQRGAVDEEVVKYYLAYELDGYFEATQGLMRQEQRKDPRRFKNAFALYQRWHQEGPRQDLNAFFEDELDFAEPPPPDEGPRT